MIEVETDRQRWEVEQKTLGNDSAVDLGTILVKAPPAEKRS